MGKHEDMKTFFNNIKKSFQDEGFSIVQEDSEGDIWVFSSALIGMEDGTQEKISVTLKTRNNFIFITIRLAYPVQATKISEFLKILNRLNCQQVSGCFFFNESTSTLDLSGGFSLLGCGADHELFGRTFAALQDMADMFFPLIHDFLTEKKNELEIYEQILKTVEGVITYGNNSETTWN